MTSCQTLRAERGLLMLAPSRGLGGGIERVAAAVNSAAGERGRRIDLLSNRFDGGGAPAVTWRARARFCARCVHAAVTERPGTVVCLHISLLPVALLTAAASRAECVLVAIGQESWGRMSRTRRWAVRRCDRFLAISTFTAQWFASRAKVDRSRVRVVALPIDKTLADIAFAQSPAAEKPRDPVLLTVARLDRDTRYKGLFEVADSLPAVLQKFPNLRWEVVGDGPARRELEERCTRLGLQDVVAFLGRVDDSQLFDAYARAWLFVMPSVASPDATPPVGEGFGLVYAEAGAFGVPALASSQGGGSADIVIDGETGVLVPPANPRALGEAIVRLLGDATLRRRLGEGARARVRSKHLPAQFATELSLALGDPAELAE